MMNVSLMTLIHIEKQDLLNKKEKFPVRWDKIAKIIVILSPPKNRVVGNVVSMFCAVR